MRAIFLLFTLAPIGVACGLDGEESSNLRRGSRGNQDGRSLLKWVKDAKDGDKLGRCEGDCDKNEHCAGDLVCYNRTGFQAVPGCPGGEQASSTTDFCVRPEDLGHLPLDYVSDVKLSAGDSPIGRCQGDCDVDEHCQGSLVCFHRNRGGKDVPGCVGGLQEKSKTDYCVRPQDIPGLNNHPAPPVSAPDSDPKVKLIPDTRKYALLPSNFPRLKLCEGNCHMDSDCEPGLWCNQREPREDVPGCLGGADDSSNYDYCTYIPPTLPPTPMPAPFPAPTESSFRLKMYWEDWYFWQEELFDRMWCMACKNGCAAGHSMHITRCSGESAYLNFVSVSPNPDYPHRDKPEVLIRVDGTNLCFELDKELGRGWPVYQSIKLQKCNKKESRQRWHTSDGSFSGQLIEISQYGRINYCISQQHFPKHGELVRMEKIKKARYDTSSYWVQF